VEGHVGVCRRANVLGQEDAYPWCSHVEREREGQEGQECGKTWAVSREKQEWGHWEKRLEKKFVQLGIQDASPCICISIDIQKPTKLLIQEVEDNIVESPGVELSHW
jgi:hypothetical protein